MDDEYPPFDIPKMTNLDTVLLHECVVKLSFSDGPQPAVGTGFFINIPNSPCEVILTAGHNLYSPKRKTFTTDVNVLFPHPSSPMPVPPEHVKVSEEYMKDTNNREADYGVILIPFNKPEPARRGLGFNMMNAFSELRGEVKVTKYGDKTPPGHPRMSSGPVVNKDSTENQLVYSAKTETGASGSPVWFTEGPFVVVVAVHNNRPEDESKDGSRGSRISPKLLRDVFTWANLDVTKRLKAEDRSKVKLMELPKSGLYMVFGAHPFARLQRGFGTTFDVLPVQVTSGGTNSTNKHMLALGTKWVMFNPEKQEAVLVDSPRERCLFTMMEMRNTVKNPGVVTINLADNFQLRMDGSKFKDHDLPEAQKTGLKMFTGKAVPFYHFTFESDPSVPFKPCTHLIVTAAPVQNNPGPQQDLSSMLCSKCRITVFGAPGII